MGVQKNIKQLQEQVNILSGALTNALKELDKWYASIIMIPMLL